MTADMKKKAQSLIQRADAAFSSTERNNAESLWSDVSEFILPNQSGLFQTGSTTSTAPSSVSNSTPGSKKTRRIYDSAAIQANQDLAAAMHSTLTNPATQWSKIRFSSEELNNDDEAVAWVQEVNKLIHKALNESNFDVEMSKNYRMFTSLGNMIMLHESNIDDPNRKGPGLRFKSLHLSEVSWEENLLGDVDTVYRRFSLTAKQAVEKWGKAAGDTIIKAFEKRPSESFDFTHIIMPRDKKDVKLNSAGTAIGKNRPIASIYIASKDNHIVEETGYYESPIHVVRWESAPGEVYGRGPGSVAIPEVRTLNTLKDELLHALAKSVNPPLFVQRSDILGSLDLRPRAVNVVQNINGIREHNPGTRFDVTQFNIDDMRNSISKIFFIDKLLLPPRNETGEMTATEILQRAEQMQRVFGPTLGRLNQELLSPLIERTFSILLREGVLPEAPDSIREAGLDVDIQFVNQLARAQQLEDVTNIQGLAQDMLGLAQIDPSVLDYFDADAAAKHISKVRGVPEAVITSDDQVEQIRQQRAQQQQQQQALEAGVAVADIQSKSQ